jgi:hypothetical protein
LTLYNPSLIKEINTRDTDKHPLFELNTNPRFKFIVTQYRKRDPRRFQKAICIFQSIWRRAAGLNAVETLFYSQQVLHSAQAESRSHPAS